MARRGSMLLCAVAGCLVACSTPAHRSAVATPPATSPRPSVAATTDPTGSTQGAGLRNRPTLPPLRHRALPTLPDHTRRLLPGHRVVAFYGAAGSPVLGVLGTATAEGLWPRLARQARAYRARRTPVLPAYELITFVATGSRGNQGNYSTRVSDAVIASYVRAARRHHALLLLDVQPGHGSFLADARSLRRWLLLPDVGLALDPEWKLYPGERPLQRIGHTDGATVEAVARWLARLTAVHHLPQKLFVVHEFTSDMVRGKAAVRRHRHLATVFNVDGFGTRGAKLGKYADFARRHRFPLGFKLFYDKDVRLLRPPQVVALHPSPVLVEYQ